MKKSENTLLKLEAALQRILEGKTNRIPESRKLSVRAVEEEASLGNGSCYYYPEFKSKIKSEVTRLKEQSSDVVLASSDIEKLRAKRNQEKELKIQYREKLKKLKQQQAVMASEHHQLSHALREAHLRIIELEEQVAKLKKSHISRIK
ncbi:hypothetical protein [Vibrio diabolicus]|uniref:hypothetical protein n=1 Tax=Vibrio diabolicus TaxID=50719 RepID=UPI0035A96CF3